MNKNDLKKCENCDVSEEKAILLAYPYTTHYKGVETEHESMNDEDVICLSCLKSEEEEWRRKDNKEETTSK